MTIDDGCARVSRTSSTLPPGGGDPAWLTPNGTEVPRHGHPWTMRRNQAGWWGSTMRKTTNLLTTSKVARLSVIGAGGALLISTLSGCSVIEGVVAPKAWAITYQLEVDGEGSDQLTGVNYGDTDGPVALDGKTITTTVGNVTTDVEAETTVRTWGVEAITAPKQPAWVEATPAPGGACSGGAQVGPFFQPALKHTSSG